MNAEYLLICDEDSVSFLSRAKFLDDFRLSNANCQECHGLGSALSLHIDASSALRRLPFILNVNRVQASEFRSGAIEIERRLGCIIEPGSYLGGMRIKFEPGRRSKFLTRKAIMPDGLRLFVSSSVAICDNFGVPVSANCFNARTETFHEVAVVQYPEMVSIGNEIGCIQRCRQCGTVNRVPNQGFRLLDYVNRCCEFARRSQIGIFYLPGYPAIFADSLFVKKLGIGIHSQSIPGAIESLIRYAPDQWE